MADGLFTWIDALYTKATLEGTPNIFMIHRFLASDKDLAIAAGILQHDCKRAGPHITFRVWQGLLPKGRGAPRFSYVAAKKPIAAEALTIRMMKVLAESRMVVEDMQGIVALAGRSTELYNHFGIDPPEKEPAPVTPVRVKKGGLLS